MKSLPVVVLIAWACAACGRGPVAVPGNGMSPGKPQAPAEVVLMQAPDLQVGVQGQLLLDVRTLVPTSGVELTIEGDAGIAVLDYAPKMLPATKPDSGSQVFVNVTPVSGGTGHLTARLVLHVGGDRQTRLVTLPIAISGPVVALPGAGGSSVTLKRDDSGELVRPMPAQTTVHEGQ